MAYDLTLTPAVPVGSESAERGRLVAPVVHVHHTVWNAALGQDLLVLDSGAFESFPHVNILKRD